MATLPREYLDNITTQRFQENVARQTGQIQQQANQIQQNVSSNQDSIAAINRQISNLPNSFPSDPYTVYQMLSVTPSITGGLSVISYSHSLGIIPKAYWITDIFVTGGYNIPYPCRTGWTSSTISLAIDTTNGGCTFNLYLVA